MASILAGLVCTARAAKINFDFGKDSAGRMPPGFASLVNGAGQPGNWKVVEELVPPTLAPISPQAKATVTTHSVLAASSDDTRPDHYSLLLFTNEVFSDFVFTTRFKISGGVDPMAGVVLRARDADNFYVVRASTAGNLLWHRVVGGRTYDTLGIGVKTPIPRDAWQELRVECTGSGTRCFLDGKLVIPPARPGAPTNGLVINDTTFMSGRIGFWCKADTQCSFVDARVEYTPKVAFAEVVAAEIKRKYPRLLGLKIYAAKSAGMPVLVSDLNGKGIGTPGTQYEQDVIERGLVYYLKDHGDVEVTMPLRDRNGEVSAALKTRMKAFPGESKEAALARATIIRKAVEQRMASLRDSTE
ncbi:MAG TPA: family 16 glycoside hydrolase [Verrucomicrobiae bacterium]